MSDVKSWPETEDELLFDDFVPYHDERANEEPTNPMFLGSSSRILGRHDLPNWE